MLSTRQSGLLSWLASQTAMAQPFQSETSPSRLGARRIGIWPWHYIYLSLSTYSNPCGTRHDICVASHGFLIKTPRSHDSSPSSFGFGTRTILYALRVAQYLLPSLFGRYPARLHGSTPSSVHVSSHLPPSLLFHLVFTMPPQPARQTGRSIPGGGGRKKIYKIKRAKGASANHSSSYV
jgi:hypothetical protein